MGVEYTFVYGNTTLMPLRALCLVNNHYHPQFIVYFEENMTKNVVFISWSVIISKSDI